MFPNINIHFRKNNYGVILQEYYNSVTKKNCHMNRKSCTLGHQSILITIEEITSSFKFYFLLLYRKHYYVLEKGNSKEMLGNVRELQGGKN